MPRRRQTRPDATPARITTRRMVDAEGEVWAVSYHDTYRDTDCPACREGRCVQRLMRCLSAATHGDVVLHDCAKEMN